MKNTLTISLLILGLLSCNRSSDLKVPPPVAKADNVAMDKAMTVGEANVSAKVDQVAFPPPPEQSVNNQVSDTAKKIIKEGTISFETSDLTKTRKAILKTLQSLNGYLSEENQSNDDNENRIEYNLKVRVPAQNFDRLLDTISAGADKIDTKNISITDVTANYIDVKTRLSNKKLLENRYTQLLAKATKISDLLEIENKLTEIRSDIESTQGQLNYLSKQVSYSSLDITFYTETTAKDNGNTFGYKLKNAISGGWNSLQNFVFWLISIWPFVIIFSVLSFLFVRWRRKRRLV